MRLKRITGVLLMFVAVLGVLTLVGCPAPVGDPSYGDLSGGPQRNPGGDPIPPPETPDITIYGIQVGGSIAAEGIPGLTVQDAIEGVVFLGEDVSAAENLKVTLNRVEGYTLAIKYAVAAPGVTPATWTDFAAEDNVLAGNITSGNYLVFQVTDGTTSEVSYYRYAITYGRNGTAIESITIAGRTFPIIGTPGIGDETAAPVDNTQVYLTAAQVVANRPIEVKLRRDSVKALVMWAPSWVTNNGAMPSGAFVTSPISNILANMNAVYIRVRSLDGVTYANYKVTVLTPAADRAVITSFTAGGATVTAMGTPAGSWNSGYLVNGAPLAVKSTRINNAIASAVATAGGAMGWAFVPDLETEPEFVALSEPLTLAYGGYVYVRGFYDNQFLNIYRLPVIQKNLSNDATLAEIRISGTVMNKGSVGTTAAGAVAGASTDLWGYQIKSPAVEVTPTDPDAAVVLAYAASAAGEFSAVVPGFSASGNLWIRVTSESGSSIVFYNISFTLKLSNDANARSVTIADIPATIAAPGTTSAAAAEGSAKIYAGGGGPSSPAVFVVTEPSATVRYAKTTIATGTPAFGTALPTALAQGNCIWIEITAEDGATVRYYKFTVTEVNTSKQYGRGIADPIWVAAHPNQVYPNLGPNELLSLEKMPDPSYWNAKGHMHDYPDLFHFANGNAVVDLADWENRRWELQLIMGYYVRGIVPSIDVDTVDISFDPTIENGPSPITVTHKASGRTYVMPVNFTILDALKTPGNRGKLTVGQINSGTAHHITGSIPDIGRVALMTLYGIPASAGYAPSRDSAGGWSFAILETAIEGVDLNGDGYIDPDSERLYGGWIDPKKGISVTGASTGGKQAAGRGVLGMSRMGTTAGFTNPATAGCLGTTLERWLAPAGYRVDTVINGLRNPNAANPGSTGPGYGWPADPIPVGDAGVGTKSADLYSAPWYMKGIENGDYVLGTTIPYEPVSAQDGRRSRAVRGWSPYFEDFDNVPQVNQNFNLNITLGQGIANNITQPYTAFRTTGYTDHYSGIQTWMQARIEDGSYNWTCPNLRQFIDLHAGLSVDNAWDQPNRNLLEQQAGIACTVPADLHFELALAAPNAIFMDDGTITPRCNPQAQWAMWIVLDEVYKFLGEQEEYERTGSLVPDAAYPNTGLSVGWDKYIWRNGIWMNWASHGAGTTEKNTAGKGHAAIYTAMVEGDDNTAYALAHFNFIKFRDSPWPVDDPVTRFDFYRMDWGRPRGGIPANITSNPTIGERVRRRVEPILPDYYKGEMYHAKPAVYPAVDARTYHNAARAAISSGALALTGPKYKTMDWRGLTDNPENL